MDVVVVVIVVVVLFSFFFLLFHCFYSHISTKTFRRALTASVDSPFSGVTKSGSLEEGAGKRCSECDYTHLALKVWCRQWVT